MRVLRRIAALPAGRRGKWLVLVFWLVVAGVAAPLAGKLTNAQNNETSAWLPGKAESTKVVDLSKNFRPDDVFPAVIVYERASGLESADEAKAASDAQAIAGYHGVKGQLIGPQPSQDGKAMQLIVPIYAGVDGWNDIIPTIKHIRSTVSDAPSGLNVYVAGPAGSAADMAGAFEGIEGTLLFAAAAVVIVILLLTYRSPVLWLLPLVTAGISLVGSQALVYLLAKHAGLTVNAQSAGILTVLVFGAGTDYALLLVARYREELRRHEDRHEAMAFALHRAGPAIVASASTVTLGMLCLLAAEMNSTKGLGPVAAVGIVVALAAMMTLLPALLVIVGRWVFWPVRPRFGSTEPTISGGWARIGRRIARRPRLVWVTTSGILGVMALGLLTLKADGLTMKESFIGTPESVVGQEVHARHFPAGVGSPVIVIGAADSAEQIKAAVGSTAGIADVSEPVVKGEYAYVEGTLDSAPDSTAAKATVDRVRSAVHAVSGAQANVGGDTAVNLDVSRAATHDDKTIIPLVLVVVFLVLTLLLRAIVAPLILIGTVVLSFAAALGVSALVFKHVFGFAGADPGLPLFVFVFLVALGIDYNIFLMTRVREEAAKHGTLRGALTGLSATGAVITSAGLVLAGTFAAMATLPMVAFAEIGFAVAFGVLLDTIVVRSVLVTALNFDVRGRMWWPSRLAAVPEEPLVDELPRESLPIMQ
jgi:RND superfamily putative drug exporter